MATSGSRRRSEMAQSLLIDSDALDELTESFPTIQEGFIKRDDFQSAMAKLGFNLTGYEKRDLLAPLPEGDGTISIETFMMLHAKVKENKDMSRNFRQDKVLTSKAELTVVQRDNSKYTVSAAEERAFSDWINRSLRDDPHCKPYLPITDPSGQLYEKCMDGILLCKLVNNAKKGTIDERTLNTGASLSSLFKRHENLVLGINSAEAIGCCVVSIFPESFLECRKHLVLGLLWQIIRNGLLGQVNLAQHAELVALLREGESIEELTRLSPEQILIRWVNYHLEKAGIDRRVNNFRDDIMDSVVYANLLQQVAPKQKVGEMIPVNTMLQSSDVLKRAQHVIRNSETLNLAAFLSPEDIALVTEKNKNRERLNLVFVANLFNTYPCLEPPEMPFEREEETLEEQTYRNWMNSLGVTPYVNNLYTDLRNGLVLLQLLDILKPGIVDWSKISRVFDAKKTIFQMQDNCSYVVRYAQEYKLNIINLSGENLREGDRILTLGLCSQMMRAYTIKLLSMLRGDGRPIKDDDILHWVNERLATVHNGESKITSFKDAKIGTARPIIDLIEVLKPGSIDYDLITGVKSDDCRLAISMARKIGARVYALPQHVEKINKNMTLTVFACLMVLDLQMKK